MSIAWASDTAVTLNSSPHRPGHEYSRSAARKQFTADDLRAAMAGIEYRDTNAFIDEKIGFDPCGQQAH